MSKRASLAGLARPKPGQVTAPAPAPDRRTARSGAGASGGAADDDMHAMTLRIPKTTSRALKLLAIDEERPVTDLVREAIDEYLRRHRG